MESTAQTKPASKKRRSRASDSPDNSGDDSKKRGRPRVEKQDESAADRRRTQIRMAQRAYRQRKESTLEELRKRVSELTNAAELMNKAFLEFSDRLASAGVPEVQLQDVHETTLQYENLMRCVRNPDEEAPLELPPTLHHESSSSGPGTETTPAAAIKAKNVPAWMDQSVVNYAPRERENLEIGMGYTMSMQESDAMDMANDFFSSFDQNSQAMVPMQKHVDQQNHYDTYRVEVPDMSVPESLSPPRTYSFHESTFGRRLHRYALEQAYHLLLEPARRPATYDRVFRLSLLSRDRTKLIASLKAMLDRGPHEPLDAEAPLIHVGGAGTHFAKRDQFGRLQPKKESWNLGIVGPQTLALLENAARDNLTTDMTVDIAGFEGEWFDPYDVEGYLAEKGIYIDPSSSFAEAEALVWSTPKEGTPLASGTSTSMSTSTPKTPIASYPNHDGARPFDVEQLENLNRLGVENADWTDIDMGSLGEVGFSDASTGSWMNFVHPGTTLKHDYTATINRLAMTPIPEDIEEVNPAILEVQLADMLKDNAAANITLPSWEGSGSTEFLGGEDSVANNGRITMFVGDKTTRNANERMDRKNIIIDVAKFVKVLTVSGVCLGRSPGFKRQDVDRALAMASFDAY